MKRLLLWGVALLVVAGVVFQSTHLYRSHKKSSRKEKRIAVTAEKPFVLIIPSYNNSAFVEKNLRSVFEQKYKNYRIIYIDDCSTDQTYAKAQELIEKSGIKERCTLRRNEKNRGALANFYAAIHSCANGEIVVALDGDDFLAHDEVLLKLNRIYTQNNVWMTYGSYLDYPTYKREVIECKEIAPKVIKNNSFRKESWVSSHLRTFYAGLFKRIRLEDLLYNGKFYPMAGDLAMIFPLLEMAGSHSYFVKDILYLYNRTNPLNDHKINFALQEECANKIRTASSYAPLKSLEENFLPERGADLLVFSYHRPLQLYALLESIQQQMSGVEKISVLYRSDTEEYNAAYEEVKAAFSSVHFVKQSNNPKADFRPLFFELAFAEKSSPYIFFAVDDMVVKDQVDLTACVHALEEAGAYGFYLTHGKHLTYCFMQEKTQTIPPLIPLEREVFAWHIKEGEADWKYPNSVDMVLYRKADVKKDLSKLAFHNPNTLESEWAHLQKNKRVGLFFSRSISLNIPLNLVNPSSNRHLSSFTADELLTKFRQGLKLDTTPLLHIENPSKHHPHSPTFISRTH